ncbi:A disintegrin and metalloproteinase with thrombospondin motifs 2-like [Linepithema humile]|uniref:A disintegrin and metalloproteinase with thrombospondin motifs 2-like n=1 Tax=Linepithema humile TaxID=83485 RepID=UPI00351E82C9
MLLILKLVLITLLNVTYAYITQDSEIILLPAWNPTGMKKIPLTLKVFGKLIELNLRRNDRTVLSAFEVWKYNAKGVTENLSQLKASNSCFYLHEDHVSFAAINFCRGNGLEGIIFMENDTLDIRPLRNEFEPLSLIDDFCVKEEINLSFGKRHLVKKSQQYFGDLNQFHRYNFKPKRRRVRELQVRLTIKLAVFFDEVAYRSIMPLLSNDKEKLRYTILAYVNCIQALFHHVSLGFHHSFDISLIRLEIMEKQPLNLPVVSDYFIDLLNASCNYMYTHNPPDDNDPRHWDVGLYLTGRDIYYNLDIPIIGKYLETYSILGVSYRNGICTPSKNISCAITEFHASEIISSGLTSFSTAAHEIGHLLGLEHDSENPEDKYDYIMSDSYNDKKRQIIWSSKSRYTISRYRSSYTCLLDDVTPENDAYVFENRSYLNLAGREWTAKAQCELFLRDKDANVVTLNNICQNLQCETPHKNTYYFTGPALAGTHCALGKECRREECVPVIEPPYIFKYCEDDNWSEWKEDTCKSSCLEESKGALVKRRFCKHETHRTANCFGPYYDVVLCDDSSLCRQNRKTITEFTTTKCTEFSRIMFDLTMKPGWQAPHEVDKPWVACTIYCVRKNYPNYFAPRLEMLDHGINPYFPDGTRCHNENGQDYYCRQHHCLPQSYSFEE